MGKLIISTAMTVDGVTDVGEWFVSGGDHNDAARESFEQAAAMLMGRKTYEGLAAYWQQEEGPWASALNPMPKYVASRTLEGPLDWNATLIEGDAAAGVSKLKEELDGDLIESGCGEFARALSLSRTVSSTSSGSGLTPVWGGGAQPFDGERVRLQHLETTTFDTGVLLHRYAPTGTASTENRVAVSAGRVVDVVVAGPDDGIPLVMHLDGRQAPLSSSSRSSRSPLRAAFATSRTHARDTAARPPTPVARSLTAPPTPPGSRITSGSSRSTRSAGRAAARMRSPAPRWSRSG